jgi:hypothetical protein
MTICYNNVLGNSSYFVVRIDDTSVIILYAIFPILINDNFYHVANDLHSERNIYLSKDEITHSRFSHSYKCIWVQSSVISDSVAFHTACDSAIFDISNSYNT